VYYRFIGHIHGAIVAMTVGAIVMGTVGCSVYTRWLSTFSQWRSLV